MSINIKIGECRPTILEGIWQLWRTFPAGLSAQIVEIHLGYLREGEHDDEAVWQEIETSILEKLMSNVALAVAVIHGKENIDDLHKLRGRPFGQKSERTVLWQKGFPRLAKRKDLMLQGHNDIADLVLSTAWTEYQGSFALFSYKNDEQIISRFIKRKWTEEDNFIAIAVYREAPSWIVLSNRFTSKELHEFLTNLFDCLSKQQNLPSA